MVHTPSATLSPADEARQVARRLGLVALVLVTLVSLAIPLLYFDHEREHLAGKLEHSATSGGLQLTHLINRDPDMWRYRDLEIQVILDGTAPPGGAQTVRVIDGLGGVVASPSQELATPCITRTTALFDAGRNVGKIEVSASLRPLILRATGVAALTLLLGGSLLLVVVLLPIRALQRTVGVLITETARADQANSTKDRFLATMSHEIRTRLNSVLGMLELLALTTLAREQRETLSLARDAGQGMRRIIDDMLDHTRLQNGRLELRPEPVALAPWLARLMDGYASASAERHVSLSQSVDPRAGPWLLVDHQRLRQILGNLIDNALQFAPDGQVSVRVERLAHEGSSQTLRFSVQDNGLGMTQAQQERLLVTLESPAVEGDRLNGGKGLGLAITRRLVELMHGQLTIESAPGSGTTVSVSLRLPLTDEPETTLRDGGREPPILAPTAPKASSPPAQQTEPVPVAAGQIVLAVDDNPTNRLLLVRQLAALELGLRVEPAASGEAALARWREGGIALVVTDCNMPQMDGYDLTRAIRAAETSEGRAHTPIIGWTANALPGTREACLAAGMDEMMTKPVALTQLRAAVMWWLS